MLVSYEQHDPLQVPAKYTGHSQKPISFGWIAPGDADLYALLPEEPPVFYPICLRVNEIDLAQTVGRSVASPTCCTHISTPYLITGTELT